MTDPHNLPPAPPEFYSRQYFLGRCGGYTEFVEAGGRIADPIRATALRMVAPRPGERIVDLGCGRGELLVAIADAGATSIGLDFSHDALVMARDTAQRLGHDVLLVRCRAEALPLKPGSIDAVLATDIVEHLPDPDLRRSVREAHDALRNGGRFVVHTAPTREFMAVGQHFKRLLQWLRREPVAPRLTIASELRDAGHSNIHSGPSLRGALSSAFPGVRVHHAFSAPARGWRGALARAGIVKFFGFNLWATCRRGDPR